MEFLYIQWDLVLKKYENMLAGNLLIKIAILVENQKVLILNSLLSGFILA